MFDSINPRDEAARCRRLARSMSDPRTVEELTNLAEEYDAQAEAAERQQGLSEPLQVEEAGGEVAVTGPARMAGSLSPEAARATGERMLEAAREAERSNTDPS